MLIVGLGNPDKKYSNTPHNLGFMALDAIAKNKDIEFKFSKQHNAMVSEFYSDEYKIYLLKPWTGMNSSGNPVKSFVESYKISFDNILVIYDDLDLNVGNFILKSNGSCGGHNGLRDIEKKIGSQEYKRLKIGISKKSNVDTKDYVLGKFSSEEFNLLDELFNALYLVIDDYFKIPFNDLMSKYNRKNR